MHGDYSPGHQGKVIKVEAITVGSADSNRRARASVGRIRTEIQPIEGIAALLLKQAKREAETLIATRRARKSPGSVSMRQPCVSLLELT